MELQEEQSCGWGGGGRNEGGSEGQAWRPVPAWGSDTRLGTLFSQLSSRAFMSRTQRGFSLFLARTGVSGEKGETPLIPTAPRVAQSNSRFAVKLWNLPLGQGSRNRGTGAMSHPRSPHLLCQRFHWPPTRCGPAGWQPACLPSRTRHSVALACRGWAAMHANSLPPSVLLACTT